MLTLKIRKAQSGQTIILIAFLMVFLAAMAGLAIDGGNQMRYQQKTEIVARAAAWNAGERLICKTEDELLEEFTNLAIEASSSLHPEYQTLFQSYVDHLNQDGNQSDDIILWEIARAAKENDFVDGESGVTITAEIDRSQKTIKVTIRKDLPKMLIGIVYQGDWFAQGYTVASANCSRLKHLNGSIVALDWRNGEGYWCDNACSVTGSTSTIDGVYSDNDLFTSGSEIDIGKCGFNGDNNTNINTTCIETESPIDPVIEDDLPLINGADYIPGGSLALAAGADYHYIDGKLQLQPSAPVCLGDGLWYVTDDVRINCSPPLGSKITIIALGSVDISTNIVLDVSPYVDGILIYSGKKTSCVNDAIKISLSQSKLSGLIYAPWGSIQFSASDTQVTGMVIGNTVKVSASNSSFVYDDSMDAIPEDYMWLSE